MSESSPFLFHSLNLPGRILPCNMFCQGLSQPNIKLPYSRRSCGFWLKKSQAPESVFGMWWHSRQSMRERQKEECALWKASSSFQRIDQQKGEEILSPVEKGAWSTVKTMGIFSLISKTFWQAFLCHFWRWHQSNIAISWQVFTCVTLKYNYKGINGDPQQLEQKYPLQRRCLGRNIPARPLLPWMSVLWNYSHCVSSLRNGGKTYTWRKETFKGNRSATTMWETHKGAVFRTRYWKIPMPWAVLVLWRKLPLTQAVWARGATSPLLQWHTSWLRRRRIPMASCFTQISTEWSQPACLP